jgi:hypothetical protein
MRKNDSSYNKNTTFKSVIDPDGFFERSMYQDLMTEM